MVSCCMVPGTKMAPLYYGGWVPTACVLFRSLTQTCNQLIKVEMWSIVVASSVHQTNASSVDLLSILDVPFPVLLSTLIRSRFQANPATLLIPIDFSFLLAVEKLYGTRLLCGSFSLNIVGSGFTACIVFSFSFQSHVPAHNLGCTLHEPVWICLCHVRYSSRL